MMDETRYEVARGGRKGRSLLFQTVLPCRWVCKEEGRELRGAQSMPWKHSVEHHDKRSREVQLFLHRGPSANFGGWFKRANFMMLDRVMHRRTASCGEANGRDRTDNQEQWTTSQKGGYKGALVSEGGQLCD